MEIAGIFWHILCFVLLLKLGMICAYVFNPPFSPLYLHYSFGYLSIFPISISPPILNMGISSSGNQNRMAAGQMVDLV
jgi:hypothetical protein